MVDAGVGVGFEMRSKAPTGWEELAVEGEHAARLGFYVREAYLQLA